MQYFCGLIAHTWEYKPRILGSVTCGSLSVWLYCISCSPTCSLFALAILVCNKRAISTCLMYLRAVIKTDHKETAGNNFLPWDVSSFFWISFEVESLKGEGVSGIGKEVRACSFCVLIDLFMQYQILSFVKGWLPKVQGIYKDITFSGIDFSGVYF